jgi:hypothetical protein
MLLGYGLACGFLAMLAGQAPVRVGGVLGIPQVSEILELIQPPANGL